MKVKLSNKYQVVIPKEARRKMKLRRGESMVVKRVTSNEITYALQDNQQESPLNIVNKYAGSLTGVWHDSHATAADWLREERDKWDDK